MESSPGQFTFSWKKVAHAVAYSYRLVGEDDAEEASADGFGGLTVVLGGGDRPLEPGSRHVFSVRALGEAPYTDSEWSVRTVTCGTEQLGTPRLAFAEVEGTTLSVGWDEVPHADEYAYALAGSDGGVFAEGSESGLSCTVENLVPGASYTFTLRALSAGGGYTPSEPASAEVSVEPVPLEPPVLTSATATGTEISVEWDAAENAARYGYTLTDMRDGSETAAGETDLPEASFEGLSPGTTYKFSVRSLPADARYAPSAWAHKNVTTEPETSDRDFRIEVDRVTTVSVAVSIVPADNSKPYFFDIFLTSEFEGLDDEAAMNWIYSRYYTEDDIYDMLSYGPDGYEWKTLRPETDFTVLCFGHDGWNRTTPMYRMRVITRTVGSSDATVGIDFEVVDAGTVDYNHDHDGLPGVILRFAPGPGCENYKYSIYDEDVLDHWSENYMINFLLSANDWYDGVYNADSESDGEAFYALGPREAMLVMREEFWDRRVRALAVGLDADDNPGPLVNVLIGIPPRGALSAPAPAGRSGGDKLFPYRPQFRVAPGAGRLRK